MKNFKDFFPHTILCSQSKFDKQGPESFFKNFKKEWTLCVDQGYSPLLLASNFSCSGEMAETYGLFEKKGVLYEVHGTECSMWDFDGQWDLEKTSWESILHRLAKGELGQGDVHFDQNFDVELKALAIHSLEKKGMLSYENCSIQQKHDCYAQPLSLADQFQFGIRWNTELASLFVNDHTYESRLKMVYADEWKKLFQDNELLRDPVTPLKRYAFEKNGVTVFATLTAAEGIEFKFAAPHSATMGFSWLDSAEAINQIAEDLVLSLLENKNMLKSPAVVSEIKKMKWH